MRKHIPLYLISDSTGETVYAFARAVMAQFTGVKVEEHIYNLVRSESQMNKILSVIEKTPGPVLYTIVDRNIRWMLKQKCKALGVPCIAILANVLDELSNYLKVKVSSHVGHDIALDDKYFERIDAIHFSIAHDDGMSLETLCNADIILVGVSRTSKTPTSMYLANKGYRAANVPFVSERGLPNELFNLTKPFIVGLTINLEHLVDIRKNRLLSLHEHNETSYVDCEKVFDEIKEAKKIFMRNKWPVIDVTRRSIEETVAKILYLYQKREEGNTLGVSG